ncbi:MAG: hypothetical protein HZA36_03590 [Parcubacteria group bacterium]|nr:hypothetical protein [Parcubacteria group bacterium]
MKKITEPYARKIVERSMATFGLQKDMETDPVQIQSLLKEMKLDDFETVFPPMREFFVAVVVASQPLGPMFKSIEEGLVNKHPAVVEFLELALSRGWLGQSEKIYKSAHITFLLEALVAAMCNNHSFFVEVQDHYKKKEKGYGIDSRHLFGTFRRVLNISHSLFDALKALSVDPAMIYFRIERGLGRFKVDKNDLRDLYKKGDLNYLEYRLLSFTDTKNRNRLLELLQINVYEAAITEYDNGFRANSTCAYVFNEDISKNPPQIEFQERNIIPDGDVGYAYYDAVQTQNNMFPVFMLSQEMTSLYIAWNMAFVLGNMGDQDFLFPKLLIPSLINGKSENTGGENHFSLACC